MQDVSRYLSSSVVHCTDSVTDDSLLYIHCRPIVFPTAFKTQPFEGQYKDMEYFVYFIKKKNHNNKNNKLLQKCVPVQSI